MVGAVQVKLPKRVYRPGRNRYDNLVHAVFVLNEGPRPRHVCACLRDIDGEPTNVWATPSPLSTVVTCLECVATAETFIG